MKESKEDNEWKDGLIHLCIRAGQSSSDADMACGLNLSTWASVERVRAWPLTKTGPIPEVDLGYTFNKAKATCPDCRTFLERKSQSGSK